MGSDGQLAASTIKDKGKRREMLQSSKEKMIVAWTKMVAVEVGRSGWLMDILYFKGFADRLYVGMKTKDDSKHFDLKNLKKGVE